MKKKLNIHFVRHFAANPTVPGIVAGREGNLARHLDYAKAFVQASKFRPNFFFNRPDVKLMLFSPAQRTHATLDLITVGMVSGDVPRLIVPELFPSAEQMPAIETAWKSNGPDVSKYDDAAISVCDDFGRTAFSAIQCACAEVTEGNVLIVGHAPTIQFAALQCAGNTPENRKLVLETAMGEGDRFVISIQDYTILGLQFVPLAT